MDWIRGFLLIGASFLAAAVPEWDARASDDPGGGADAAARLVLESEFSLGGVRTDGPRYYILDSRLVNYAEDGTRAAGETYRLRLAHESSPSGPADGDRYVCRKLTVRAGDGPDQRIPALEGWSYSFLRTDSGRDEKGQVFGIAHARFQNLSDEVGSPLPPDVAYAVYNCFIDFHAFCNALSEPTRGGKGVQDLKRVGQKIVHESAFSETPVNLGEVIAEGSSFKNGEVTLELKGLGAANGKACAIVGFDSGDASFRMKMRPAPNAEITTTGASHYRGTLSIDLTSRWVEAVELDELVVASVTMGGRKLTNTVVERRLTIRSVSQKEFEED
jgi:hypothetical protein